MYKPEIDEPKIDPATGQPVEHKKKKGLGAKLKEKLGISKKSSQGGAITSSGTSSDSSDDEATHGSRDARYTGTGGAHALGPAGITGAGGVATTHGQPRQVGDHLAAGPGAGVAGVGAAAPITQSRDTHGTGTGTAIHGGTKTTGDSHHTVTDAPGRRHESKFDSEQTDKAFHGSASGAGDPAWKEAQKYTEAAAKESASVDFQSREAKARAEEATLLFEESERARLRYEESVRKLKELEAARPNLDGIAREVGSAREAAEARARDAEVAIRDAQKITEEARLRYDEAKAALDTAERKRLAAAELDQDAAARRKRLDDTKAKGVALEDEDSRLRGLVDTKRGLVDRMRAELEDAKRLVELKAKELEDARARADLKNREFDSLYAEFGRLETAAATKHEETLRHAKVLESTERELAPLEERLRKAQEEARLAQTAAQEKARLAQEARDRAVEIRAQAERAAASVNDVKGNAVEKARELERLRALEAEHNRKLEPLQRDADQAAGAARDKHALAERKVEEWREFQQKLSVQKGKTHEYWHEAKVHGDRAEAEVARAMEKMEERLQASAAPTSIEASYAAGTAIPGDHSKSIFGSHGLDHHAKTGSHNVTTDRKTYTDPIPGRDNSAYTGTVPGAGTTGATGATSTTGHHLGSHGTGHGTGVGTGYGTGAGAGQDTVGGSREAVDRVTGSHVAATNLGQGHSPATGTGTTPGSTTTTTTTTEPSLLEKAKAYIPGMSPAQ